MCIIKELEADIKKKMLLLLLTMRLSDDCNDNSSYNRVGVTKLNIQAIIKTQLLWKEYLLK